MLNAQDFDFCGEKLSDYGFVIGSFNGGNDVETLNSGNIQVTTITLPKYRKNIIHGKQFGEPIQITFQVVKLDENCSPLYVTDNEYDAIKRWLERDTYNFIRFDDEQVYFNALITVAGVSVNGKVVGFELTVKSDSGFSYSEELTTTLLTGQNTFTDNSALVDYTYPTLVITCTEDGDFQMSNALDDNRTMEVKNCVTGEILTVDCEHKTIQTNVSGHDLSSDFNYKFFRFLNTRQTRSNTITVTGGSVNMTYRFTRMVTR